MSNRPARWAWRAGVVGFTTVAIAIVTMRLELQPDPARLLIVVALVIVTFGLILDSVPDRMPTFDLPTARYRDTRGADQRTSFFRRLIEAHQAAREPDPAVRDRLVELAEATLEARHGISLRSPVATELLGQPVLAALSGEPRRWSLDEIDRLLTRIEEL